MVAMQVTQASAARQAGGSFRIERLRRQAGGTIVRFERLTRSCLRAGSRFHGDLILNMK